MSFPEIGLVHVQENEFSRMSFPWMSFPVFSDKNRESYSRQARRTWKRSYAITLNTILSRKKPYELVLKLVKNHIISKKIRKCNSYVFGDFYDDHLRNYEITLSITDINLLPDLFGL